jgi:hypothetical protein
VMRRLKSIASGRTSISSDPVSISFLFSKSLFGCWENGGKGRGRKENNESIF